MPAGPLLFYVIIENKPASSDPEGETIQRHLILRKGFDRVKSVRSAKLLKIQVEARDADEARSLVESMCRELRLYNPAVHTCTVIPSGDGF